LAQVALGTQVEMVSDSMGLIPFSIPSHQRAAVGAALVMARQMSTALAVARVAAAQAAQERAARLLRQVKAMRAAHLHRAAAQVEAARAQRDQFLAEARAVQVELV